MFYKGRIDEIKRVVVSDPSYGKDVWCRYECTKLAWGKPWNVQLAVNEVVTPYEDFTCKGVGFGLLLVSGSVLQEACRLEPDGSSFSYPSKLISLKETEIGMDTACVALGINSVADEISASKGSWQPPCALRTLTDGMFGVVYEGTNYGYTHLIYVDGYLDEDTGYSVEDIVRYLTAAFEIKDLQLVQEKQGLDAQIAEAGKQVEEPSGPAKDSGRGERA